MGYFPESLGIKKEDQLFLIRGLGGLPDKVLRGYAGCHYIRRYGNIELILDCRYKKSGAEEITGLSSKVRTKAKNMFMITQYINTDDVNEMHYFAKVCSPKAPSDFPVSFVNGEVLPSHAPKEVFYAEYEGFALKSEFFDSFHEAELHIKHNTEYYGALDKIDGIFHASIDSNGSFLSLAVKSLLKVRRILHIPVLYGMPGGRAETVVAALCSSPLEDDGDMLVIIPRSDARSAKAMTGKQGVYLWCQMIVSLDPAVCERSDGALFDEDNLLRLLSGAVDIEKMDRLEPYISEDAELFCRDEHIIGREDIMDYLKRCKGPYSQCHEFYDAEDLPEDFDGREKGSPVIAVLSFPDMNHLGYVFISEKDGMIDRIMFRYMESGGQ